MCLSNKIINNQNISIMRKNFLLLMLMALLPLTGWAQESLSDAQVTVNPVYYNGSDQASPTMFVTLGETPLTAGTDYDIEGWYSDATCETAVTEKKDAGIYYVKIKGDGTNYDDETFAVGSFIINKASLTVTGNDVTITYGDATPETADFYAETSVTGFVGSDDETILGPVVYTTYDFTGVKHVGEESIQLFASTDNTYKNYSIGITNSSVKFKVDKKSITVTVNPYIVDYSGELIPVATADDLESKFYSLNSADKAYATDIVCTVTGAAISAKNVGNWAFKLSANDDYDVTYTSGDAGTLRINSIALKVTANPVTINYGETPTYTYQWDGLADADKKTVNGTKVDEPIATAVTIGTPYVLDGATAYAGNVGTYAITPNVTSPNYTITTTNGILTVNRKDLSAVTITTPANSAYTGTEKNPTVQLKDGSNTVNTSGWTVSYKYSATNEDGATFTSVSEVKNAGYYKQEVYGQDNYTGTITSGVFQVEKIDLLVKAKNYTTYYRAGSSIPYTDFAIEYTGFVNGETADDLETAPTILSTATNVGTYTIIPSGGVSTNYNLVYVGGELKINPASLVVVPKDRTVAFGSNESKVTSWTGKEYFSKDLGTAKKAETYIYVKRQNGVNAAGNPTYANVTDNATIFTLLAKTADDYDASTPGVDNYFITGLTLTRTSGTNKGEYQISASGAAAASSNYTISFGTGKFTIDKGTITFALNNQTKVYGDDDPEFKYEISGASAADAEAIKSKVTVSRQEGQNVGTYTISLSMTDADKNSFTNYNFSAFPTAKLIITKRSMTIKAADQLLYAGQTADALDQNAFSGKDMKYSDQLPLKIEFDGAVTLDGDNKLTISEGDKVFTDGIVIATTLTGDALTAINANYDIKYEAGDLTVINPAATLYLDDTNTALAEAIEEADGASRTVKFSSRVLKAGQWNTLVLPFEIEVAELSKALGYAVVDMLAPSASADVISLKLAFGTIEANVPFLVQPAKDVNLNTVTFTGMTIVYSANPKVDDNQGHEFIGTYTSGKAVTSADKSEYYYSTSEKKFVNSNSSTNVGIMRAYLKDNGVSTARAINIEEPNGTVTSISTVSEAIDEAGETFNINGMKMNGTPAKKGVYIRNGKKVVIK